MDVAAPATTPAPATMPAPDPAADDFAPTAAATPIPAPAAEPADLATDLYALIVYLHKNCNADLFEALGRARADADPDQAARPPRGPEAEITLKQAAELVHVSLPAASRIVDDLVRRGFVQRREDPADRRMKRVSLTEAGQAR